MKTTNRILRRTLCLILGLVMVSPIFAQKKNDKLIKLVQSYADIKECNFFEATSEMFKLLSEHDKAEGEMKEFFSKTEYAAYAQCRPRDNKKWFFDSFRKKANLDDYSLLMRSRSSDMNYEFYKRDLDKGVKEYLLVHAEGIYFIISALDIATIQEMASFVKLIGDVGGQ